MSRFAVMDPETGDWVEVTEEGIRLGLSLDDAANDPELARLRKIEEAARDISRRTFVDDGVVAHVPFYKLYTLRQRLYGSDEEIIAALDALDGSE